MSKIPQEAIKAAQNSLRHDYVHADNKTVARALEAADATRAQGAEVEPVAFQRQETDGQWANDFSKDPDMQEYWRSWQFRSRKLYAAPQPTEREKVLEDALREICRVSWPAIGGAGLDMQKIAKAALAGEAPSQTELDNQPRYTTKRLRDEVAKAKNYARIEALEDAARQAEKVPCEPGKSIAAAIRQLKVPSQTDTAEGGE